jgi:hypothetical protein
VLVSPYSWLPAWTSRDRWLGGFHGKVRQQACTQLQLRCPPCWPLHMLPHLLELLLPWPCDEAAPLAPPADRRTCCHRTFAQDGKAVQSADALKALLAGGRGGGKPRCRLRWASAAAAVALALDAAAQLSVQDCVSVSLQHILSWWRSGTCPS